MRGPTRRALTPVIDQSYRYRDQGRNERPDEKGANTHGRKTGHRAGSKQKWSMPDQMSRSNEKLFELEYWQEAEEHILKTRLETRINKGFLEG